MGIQMLPVHFHVFECIILYFPCSISKDVDVVVSPLFWKNIQFMQCRLMYKLCGFLRLLQNSSQWIEQRSVSITCIINVNYRDMF